MRQLVAGWLVVLLCLVLAACSGSDGGAVKWPALSKLDETTHRLSAAAKSAPREDFLKLMQQWSEAAAAVAAENPPANVANGQRVTMLQRDLASLAKSASTAHAMPEEFARKMASGLDHAVGDLMLAAGLPHVHAHAEGEESADDGHDHAEGADHDHSEHDGHNHADHEGHDHAEGEGHEGHAH